MGELWKPSRRDFNKALIGAGMGAAFATGLAPFKALAEEPRRGGILRVAAHGQSVKDTLDPAKFVQSTDYARGHMVYNALTRLGDKGQAEPELAESFEANSDATEWVFKLRQGVTFHDGKALDTDDVIFSIMRHKDEAVASASKAFVEDILDVVADGKDTVRVKLKSPNADMPVILGTFGFMIVKKGTTDFSKGIGTGPFKLKEFKPGIRSVVVRNENYFKPGQPYVDEIEYFGIVDPIARFNALVSGDVHIMSNLMPDALQDAKNTPGIEVLSTPCPRFIQFAMMCDRKPTDNVDLRSAIKNLIDRDRIVSQILQGEGVAGNDHFVMPQSPYYNTSLPQHGVDVDKAKFHLKKAGMENGSIDLHVSEAVPNSTEMALLLQAAAAGAGLTVNLIRDPSDSYWSNIWMKQAFASVIWNPRPTEVIMGTLLYKSDSPWNDTRFKHPQLDQLIASATGATDTAKRKELLWDIQKIIYDDGGSAVPVFVNYLDAHSSKVKGLVPIPTGNLSGFNFADRVWLES